MPLTKKKKLILGEFQFGGIGETDRPPPSPQNSHSLREEKEEEEIKKTKEKEKKENLKKGNKNVGFLGGGGTRL